MANETINTTAQETEKKKSVLQRIKDAKAEYDKRVGNLDKQIGKALAMAKLIEKMNQSASHGELYVMTDADKNEFGEMGAEKLARNYSNLMRNIEIQKKKIAEWFEAKMQSINEFENGSPFEASCAAAQKSQQEYMLDFVNKKAEQKIKAML